MTLHSIGIIKTPFKELQNMPIQPKGSESTIAKLIINKEYEEGLKDLDGFSHIYLIYYFHKTTRTELSVIPFMDIENHGVFATRSPLRPSHIGMSLTKIISVTNNIVTVEGIDILDETPLLDIKPYIPQFEQVNDVKTGWMKKNENEVSLKKSDTRFI
ncbi:tRNA (N6-threonylcarbamoyladenosine(37)-N6)-methyltransferase TrmO [Sulfurimonas sp.]|uniref:tRNA (N6-threonylcarbamoyladenosine(37)-N6)-methyltransferase TrmO n=1 Tax=Sulfurimonas sp. TaxID=2022749 RepID=UPI0039E625B7